MARRLPPTLTAAVLCAAVLGFGAVGWWRLQPTFAARQKAPARRPLRVPLFVPPAQVVYDQTITLSFDDPTSLSSLRAREHLDDVVAGAADTQDSLWRLARWTRAQFDPGRPDPYPPPDAALILDEIRSGRTGGFCAQYCFVFLQAARSLGFTVRMVTVEGHELAEAWLGEEQRWVAMDPMYGLQVTDSSGRALSALEIRRSHLAGELLLLSNGHSYPGSAAEYAGRFRRLAVWARNDFIDRPLNFADFDRCRVWIDPANDDPIPDGAFTSRDGHELYLPPPKAYQH